MSSDKKRKKPYKTKQMITLGGRYIRIHPSHPFFPGYRKNGYGPIDAKKDDFDWIFNHLSEKIWFKDPDIQSEFVDHWSRIND